MAIWCFQRSSEITNIQKIRDLEKSCKAKDQKIQELERTLANLETTGGPLVLLLVLVAERDKGKVKKMEIFHDFS